MKQKREIAASELHCSFCGKSQETVGKLISSATHLPRAYICDQCVDVCNSIFVDARKEARPSTASNSNEGWRFKRKPLEK